MDNFSKAKHTQPHPKKAKTSHNSNPHPYLPSSSDDEDTFELSIEELCSVATKLEEELYEPGSPERVVHEFTQYIPEPPGKVKQYVEDMYYEFMNRTMKSVAHTRCAFVHPVNGGVKHSARNKFVRRIVSEEIWWAKFDEPSQFFVQLAQGLYALTNLFFDSDCPKNNVIGVLYGHLEVLPGEDSDFHVQAADVYQRYYCMSSVCVNESSQGLYLDVKATPFRDLGHSSDPEEVNCTIVSVKEPYMQVELLQLCITRHVNIGEQLYVGSPHFWPFNLVTRGHGKRLNWFNENPLLRLSLL